MIMLALYIFYILLFGFMLLNTQQQLKRARRNCQEWIGKVHAWTEVAAKWEALYNEAAVQREQALALAKTNQQIIKELLELQHTKTS